MSTAVPVVPYHGNLIQDEKELYRFLLSCQEKSIDHGKSQIVSFSQKINLIDPLAVLEEIIQPNLLYCYWENRRKDEAILGYGVTKSLTLDSPHRFSQSQEFIENSLNHTLRVGEVFNGEPYWFCSFTFFESELNQNTPFPAATIFLPQIQIIKKQQQCILVVNCSINPKINLKLLLEQINYNTQFINRSRLKDSIDSSEKSSKNLAEFYPSYNFKSAVASALKSIESHQFSKLVLAHAIDVIAAQKFPIVASLNNLRKQYPDCYTFSLSNGKGHHFIGASPERLISIENQQLVTDALAGSAPRGKTPQEDHNIAQTLLRNEKERREHQAVSEFISQRLFKLGLAPHCSPLKLLKLSNIQHLWTPIYAHLKPQIHPLQIVAQLHPTPAVAGVPTDIACEQIRQYETFDRGLYAAPLGWIDFQGNSEFIVGIRSALIQDNIARLYAGAGIVSGSDPDKELAEIQLKFQALMKALL
ncbi:isochorismate synthase [Gloeothece citriformis PCC 7424]|uniref:isochorismate synthase n=1 Tax=Gloeothece citriformis (strain PCC 7424) TaxID=65393 RepID=B7KCZ0_GLOC7|nr:isochorismate synthase [Gloeothece citriformis]ACK73111.1 isochorismate synthase [Gloeothece citriformis PCC 7424]